MKLKKLFCVLIALLAINTSLYAMEVSLGFSAANLGAPIFHGEDYKDFEANLAGNHFKKSFPFSYRVSVDIMVEFLPFLALETGIGYGSSFVRFNDIDKSDRFPLLQGKGLLIEKTGFSIPLMLRAQFEFSRLVLYASAGPKIFIPTSDFFTIVNDIFSGGYIEDREFALDLGFSLGTEFRLGKASYLGLRLNYDLNLISHIKRMGSINDPSFHQDNIGVSLTYRYAFGSKWKK